MLSLLLSLVIMLDSQFATNHGLVYEPVFLEQVQTLDTASFIRVDGRYETDNDFSELLRGTLHANNMSLRVEGSVFDWQPENGDVVELWGELRQDDKGVFLYFHNGYRLDSELRQPRPSPSFKSGDQLELWLDIRQTGSRPFTVIQGSTEDRKVFWLSDYQGELGYQCIQAEVNIVTQAGQERFLLSNIAPCSV